MRTRRVADVAAARIGDQDTGGDRLRLPATDLSRGRAYRRSGSANTYIAFPVAGGCSSGAIVAGTSRGLPPPLPVMTAMYCLPSMLKVTGKPWTEVGSRVSHKTLPVLTSNARKCRSRSPANATPPAVEMTAVMNGARCSWDPISFMVLTAEAGGLPILPSEHGIS